MARTPYNVLFLCTGNSARSILAESLMNAMAYGRCRAFSAGSTPSGRVRPRVIAFLQERNLPVDGLRSKSWDEFALPNAPKMDFVITVCDDASREACPTWPGRPATAHWGVPDPATAEDPGGEQRAIEQAAHILRRRIARFLALPLEQLDRAALQLKAREIGEEPSTGA